MVARTALNSETERRATSLEHRLRLARDSDPLESDAYGFVECPVDEVDVRKAYGEVVTPIGMFLIGRQSTTLGTGVVAADGDGRPNRFGVSPTGELAHAPGARSGRAPDAATVTRASGRRPDRGGATAVTSRWA